MTEVSSVNVKEMPREMAIKIKDAQKEFLNQLKAGATEEEAFVSSLSTVSEKYNPKDDEFVTYDSVCPEKVGKMAISPDNAKAWLEVIGIAVPLLTQIINMVKDNIPKKLQAQQEEN